MSNALVRLDSSRFAVLEVYESKRDSTLHRDSVQSVSPIPLESGSQHAHARVVGFFAVLGGFILS